MEPFWKIFKRFIYKRDDKKYKISRKILGYPEIPLGHTFFLGDSQ